MADKVLNILVRAQDQASAPLSGIAGGVQSLGAKLSGLATMRIGGGVLGQLLGGAGAAFGVRSMINAYGEAERAEAKLSSVLRSTGGAAGLTKEQLTDYAGELQRVSTFEDDAIVNAEAMLLTFTNVKGGVFKDAVRSAMDLSVVMDQDLKSSIVQVGKALNDPIEGMNALRRVGVSFTDEQREQVRVLQESGDLMGAQGVILAELQKEFGGAAEGGAMTLTGQIEQLNNAVGNLAESIGGALVGALDMLAGGKLGDFAAKVNFIAEDIKFLLNLHDSADGGGGGSNTLTEEDIAKADPASRMAYGLSKMIRDYQDKGTMDQGFKKGGYSAVDRGDGTTAYYLPPSAEYLAVTGKPTTGVDPGLNPVVAAARAEAKAADLIKPLTEKQEKAVDKALDSMFGFESGVAEGLREEDEAWAEHAAMMMSGQKMESPFGIDRKFFEEGVGYGADPFKAAPFSIGAQSSRFLSGVQTVDPMMKLAQEQLAVQKKQSTTLEQIRDAVTPDGETEGVFEGTGINAGF